MSQKNTGKDKKKGAKGRDLKQYMDEEEANLETQPAPVFQQPRNVLIEEEDEGENLEINLDDKQAKERLNHENMDKISDVVVTMIFKNKINQKNAFDIPLPDATQLTDFQQASGDTSWKKLSQTLDAGAKIYGYRVDSVHTETYKVLGGLNRTDLMEVLEHEGDATQEEKDHGRRARRDMDGENTLEKNLNNLDTNKYDLEFDLDPLFQKTSAKFDEGGAKGLILNNVNVNSSINLMFESGNALGSSTDYLGVRSKTNKITKAAFKEIKGAKTSYEQLKQFKLCPELLSFKNQYLDKMRGIDELLQLDINPMEKIGDVEDVDKLLPFENLAEEEKEVRAEIRRNMIEDDDSHFEERDQMDDFRAGPMNDYKDDYPYPTGYNENTQTTFNENSRSLSFANVENKLKKLGGGDRKALDSVVNDHRDWMGPASWKTKRKKTKRTTKTKEPKEGGAGDMEEEQEEDESKTKKEKQIQFDFTKRENAEDIFGIKKKTPSKKKHTIHETEPNPKTLLPVDFQVKTYRLNDLFLRSINFEVHDKDENENNEITRIEQNADMMNEEERMENGVDDDMHETIEKNLDAFARKSDKELDYDKTSKNVNIKALKETIWSYISNKVTEIDQDMIKDLDEDNQYLEAKKKKANKKQKQAAGKGHEGISFSDVCDRIPTIFGITKQANVSVHSCFVTLLHLANEKGLRLVKEGEDFSIFKEVV